MCVTVTPELHRPFRYLLKTMARKTDDRDLSSHGRRFAGTKSRVGPFQSALWPHIDMIRKLRLARKTWATIADELQKMGVSTSPQAIGQFFRRAKSGKRPCGWEQEMTCTSEQAQPKASRAVGVKALLARSPEAFAVGDRIAISADELLQRRQPEIWKVNASVREGVS